MTLSGLFFSPSGCTFWGKKPWSQTRKILWQVGMLLGAPVVISLMAGIAIPVIIVGIPIYMGRKVSEKYTECEFLFYHVKDFYSQKT